jgi:aromatic ring-opening dioxygenase LigB subunit
MSLLAAFMVPHPPMIVSEIGKGREQEIIKTKEAYETIANEISELKPETIIISSPHAPLYSDYFYIASGKEGSLNANGSKT